MRRPAPRLIVITDLSLLEPRELVSRVAAVALAAQAGSLSILLRDHQASARERLGLGRELRQLARAAEQQLWVADRLDLALLLEADGVHLGEGSVSAPDARLLLGPDLHLSRAWHRPDVEGLAAELEALDALLLSPVFAARKGRQALGVSALSSLRATLHAHVSPIRLYALGGVTATDVPACDAAGAAGVAAIGAALSSDPRALLEALQIHRC